jgi:hypothetical protein
MAQAINANDLKPGDRVVLRMQKSRHGPVEMPITFERYHDPSSLAAKLAQPDAMVIPGQWEKALAVGRRLAAFRLGKMVGVFTVDDQGRLFDEEDREIDIVRREGAHG